MSESNPLPTPRYRIEFSGHAQTWEGIEQIIREMQLDIAMQRTPGPRSIASGGGWHVEITEPDPTQTPERWEAELLAWRDRERTSA